jgi:predicted O-methyltransferase YrrM
MVEAALTSGPEAAPPLAEAVRRAAVATAGRRYPDNPVLRELIERKAFTHNGQVYRAAHRMEAEVCELAGRLMLAHGLRPCLEIGTLYGFSTLFLAEAAAATGGLVETVDIRPASLPWDRHRAAEPQVIENVHEVAERLVAESGLGEHVRFIAGDSNTVLPCLIREGRRFALALVDGAHDYPRVLLDVLSIDNLLAPGGYLILDDVDARMAARENNAGGPNRVLASLFASGRYDVLPLSGYAALCRKVR